MIVVRPAAARSRATWTSFSDSVSSAEVASSSNKIFGLRTRALAIAIRCFWPPESVAPPSPAYVSMPFGSFFRLQNMSHTDYIEE